MDSRRSALRAGVLQSIAVVAVVLLAAACDSSPASQIATPAITVAAASPTNPTATVEVGVVKTAPTPRVTPPQVRVASEGGSVGANESCLTYLGSTPEQKQAAATALATAYSDTSPIIIVRASIRTYCEFHHDMSIADIYHG
jgi:hypothetical protein